MLPAGVCINVGVEYEDVDVAAVGKHVIESAIADVVSPAVTTDQPNALLDEVISESLEPPSFG